MWSVLLTMMLVFGWQWTPTVPGSVTPETRSSGSKDSAIHLIVDGEPVQYDVMGVFVLPGDTVSIAASPLAPGVAVQAEPGMLESIGSNQWKWHAPREVGTYPLRVERLDGEPITLNVFVMVPYDSMRHGRIGTYRIGEYPKRWDERGSQYDRPRGFVEVTAVSETMRVAPHFRLNQFLCKGAAGYPQYLVLRQTLLIKLERLLEIAHEHGVEANTFHLMSAYRTPSYNRAIGNTTSFSRHQYGDAADVFVDEQPEDGVMDDLNGDGRTSVADARVLSGWANEIDRSENALVGGLSAYAATKAHGPFVHVDARGCPARW